MCPIVLRQTGCVVPLALKVTKQRYFLRRIPLPQLLIFGLPFLVLVVIIIVSLRIVIVSLLAVVTIAPRIALVLLLAVVTVALRIILVLLLAIVAVGVVMLS